MPCNDSLCYHKTANFFTVCTPSLPNIVPTPENVSTYLYKPLCKVSKMCLAEFQASGDDFVSDCWQNCAVNVQKAFTAVVNVSL
jgi:hypothetical protein